MLAYVEFVIQVLIAGTSRIIHPPFPRILKIPKNVVHVLFVTCTIGRENTEDSLAFVVIII